ncbi:MAG: carboxymuconolactone decarboxylase family protein [Candidatus Hydrogenedentes bacterium]|nr:carboxymuconolactone decarboxylase family protein [Candidatus Hydrogenedentota bacterium]
MESKTPMKKYWFGKRAPEHADAWYGFYKTVGTQGVLDKKTKELISVAAGSLLRCEHCVKAHVADALRAGATKEEIAEALTVASLLASATQLFWMAPHLEELLGSEEA